MAHSAIRVLTQLQIEEFPSSILDSNTDYLVSYSVVQGQRPAILLEFLEAPGYILWPDNDYPDRKRLRWLPR
jgi:hypothetical protein